MQELRIHRMHWLYRPAFVTKALFVKLEHTGIRLAAVIAQENTCHTAMVLSKLTLT
jgi:hypothetical protein